MFVTLKKPNFNKNNFWFPKTHFKLKKEELRRRKPKGKPHPWKILPKGKVEGKKPKEPCCSEGLWFWKENRANWN